MGKTAAIRPISYFLLLLSTSLVSACGDSKEVLEPTVYHVQKAQGQSSVPIDKKYFNCSRNIDFLFSELPERASVPSRIAESATRERPFVKAALSQKIQTQRVHSADLYNHWKQYMLCIVWIIAFLILLPGGGLLDIKNNPREYRSYVLPVTLVGVAILGSLFLRSYNYVWFDNAADAAVIIKIDNKSLTVPPRSHTEIYMNGGNYRIRTVDPKTDNTLDDCIVSVPSCCILVYNIRNLNEYTIEYGAYIYPK